VFNYNKTYFKVRLP